MNGFRFFIFLLLFGGLLALAGARAEGRPAFYESQIEAGPDENFEFAAVQLWMPTVPEKVRGVLCVILHPLGQGASLLADPEPWIELARSENCALMSVSFAQSDDLTRDWCRAEQGTGRAVLASLSDIALQSGVPSLTTVPVVAVGVCAAGQFAFHLAAFASSRVASFVTIGGGKHDLSKVEAAAAVSALLVTTPDRGPSATQNLQSLYTEGKSLSAPWQVESEPIAQYNAGRCSSRVISFLRCQLAGLGKSASERTEVNLHLDTAPGTWLPISICGIKLPQVTVNPPTLLLEPLNSSAGIQTQSFTLVAAPKSSVATILTFQSDGAIQTSVREKSPYQWNLECRFDPEKLPLGPFKLAISIRYLAKNNKRILGGERAVLCGFITGSVTWQPVSLNFGPVEAGHASIAFVKIGSRDGGPVRIGEVGCPYPWIEATSSSGPGNTVIKCEARPPLSAKGEEFAGYIRVEMWSPVRRSIKLFCCGSVNKSPNQHDLDK
jgi:hypothetical protein